METIGVFEQVSVRKAVSVNAVPAIISMLVVLVYNVADTFFIGQTGDEMQVAAVSLATPVFLLFMAIGTLYGIGGTSVISRALGENRPEYARRVSSFCFWVSLFTGVLLIAVFYAGMDFILSWIGTSAQTEGFARVYLECVAWSAPFVIVSNAFSNIVRAEGRSMEAMVGMIAGTVVNIVLDPIFILTLEQGIEGAAWATVIGNLVAAVYYWFILTGKVSRLSVAWRDFQVKSRVVREVFAIGVPAALNCVLMSVSNVVLNVFLVAYGDIAVAAMGVAMKVCMVTVLLQLGLGQGIQPLLGYCYGAKDWVRFGKVVRFSNVIGLVMGVCLTFVCYLFADVIVRCFIDSDGVFDYGVRFIRILLVSGPVIGVLFVYVNALQAMGAAKSSLVLSLSRQGFIFFPCLVVCHSFFHLTGLVVAQPVADVVSCLLAWWLFMRVKRVECH